MGESKLKYLTPRFEEPTDTETGEGEKGRSREKESGKQSEGGEEGGKETARDGQWETSDPLACTNAIDSGTSPAKLSILSIHSAHPSPLPRLAPPSLLTLPTVRVGDGANRIVRRRGREGRERETGRGGIAEVEKGVGQEAGTKTQLETETQLEIETETETQLEKEKKTETSKAVVAAGMAEAAAEAGTPHLKGRRARTQH